MMTKYWILILHRGSQWKTYSEDHIRQLNLMRLNHNYGQVQREEEREGRNKAPCKMMRGNCFSEWFGMIQKLSKQIETFYSSGKMKSWSFQISRWKPRPVPSRKHAHGETCPSHGGGSAPATEELSSSPECSLTFPWQCSQKCELGWDQMRNFDASSPHNYDPNHCVKT